MKIRTGFVSNSSTQSFVMLGIDTDQLDMVKDDLKKKLAEQLNYELPDWADDLDDVSIYELLEDHEEFGTADEGRYFGIRLAQASDDGIGTFSLSLTEVGERENRLRTLLNDLELGEVVEIRLVGGIEAC